MAARKKRRKTASGGSSLRIVLTHGCVLLAGLAAGYLARSFVPLPLVPAPLGAGESANADDGDRLAEEARRERARLEEELETLRARAEEKEEEMAEMQIREILGENM